MHGENSRRAYEPRPYHRDRSLNVARRILVTKLSDPLSLGGRQQSSSLAEFAFNQGIDYRMPMDVEVVSSSRQYVPALVQYSLFEASRPVTVRTLVDSMFQHNWLSATVHTLVLIGGHLRPIDVSRDIVAVGTRFRPVDPVPGIPMSYYPCLRADSENGRWSLEFSNLQPEMAATCKAYLFWTPDT